ncbi:hypothetical protein M0812_04568 [Anaeramoeba flamelloides]|uniref:Uncharacterized protein n=1 Tax=Anaeramoeba flamelloides TaxID=1746091 RepID=A0AAV8AK01_9EUKA|nr:hypothetical protein M0812_04568 [Anaeramoeba flamelloides]
MNCNLRTTNTRKRSTEQRNNFYHGNEESSLKQRKYHNLQCISFEIDSALIDNEQQRKQTPVSEKPQRDAHKTKSTYEKKKKTDKILSCDKGVEDEIITLDYLLSVLKNDQEEDFSQDEKYNYQDTEEEEEEEEENNLEDSDNSEDSDCSEESYEEEFCRVKKLESKVGELSFEIKELHSKTENSISENQSLNNELYDLLKFLSNTEQTTTNSNNLQLVNRNCHHNNPQLNKGQEIEKESLFVEDEVSFTTLDRVSRTKTTENEDITLFSDYQSNENAVIAMKNDCKNISDIELVYLSRNDQD